MKLFETTREMGHQQVLFCHDQDSDLKAIIAIHNTDRGPAMGATRLWPYASEAEALQDALRLSRGMTYKAACANLPVGGGKAVIIAKPEKKSETLLRAYGRFVESLNGRFITGQDVNLSPQDVRTIHQETRHVVGVLERSGGPAPVTALGVLYGIKAAAEFRLGRQSLEGLKVAVQGLGNVGSHLCRHLHEAGASLVVSDMRPERAAEIADMYGAVVVSPAEIHAQSVDIFAPCALGGILNSTTIPQIQAAIVAGAANNQLADEWNHAQLLHSRGILYCPDYVINAGGLINVYNELVGYEEETVLNQLHGIYDTLLEIFSNAQAHGITTQEAAKRLAEARILSARNGHSLLVP